MTQITVITLIKYANRIIAAMQLILILVTINFTPQL